MESKRGSMPAEIARLILESPPFPFFPALRERILELGQKANEGTLSEDEHTEYETYIDFGDVYALLRLRAKGAYGE